MDMPILLIDDKRGRKVAKIKPDQNRGFTGRIASSSVFMSESLMQTVLELAGETNLT